MKTLICTVQIITLTFLLAACGKDEIKGPSSFDSGLYVINEGNYTDADGSLTFVHRTGKVEQNIFSSANNGRLLGDVVMSMAILGDRAYISVNNSNKLEIVEATTMTSLLTKEDVQLPRYVTVNSDKGYLTEWVGYFESSGRVTEFDLETGETIRQAATGNGSENLLVANGIIYVSNAWTNTVSLIDQVSFEKLKDLEVGAQPGTLVRDQLGNVWVICGGSFGEVPDGRLVSIDKNTLETDVIVNLGFNPSTKMATDRNGHRLYFMEGVKIYEFDLALPANRFREFLTIEDAVSLYGIGVDRNDNVYVADSYAFQGNGRVTVFQSDGKKVNEFETGRGPSGFVFVE